MDKKEAIALFVEQAAGDYVSEPLKIELLDGLSKGTRLQGCVGWAGDGWRVTMNRNSSDWQLFKRLWHEVAHVYHGDTPKVVDSWGHLDRDIIAGVKNIATEARLEAYIGKDAAKEARADQFALAQAQRWLPVLNSYLGKIGHLIQR